MADLYVGLVHYPIYNKRMNVIAGAVTNFDIQAITSSTRWRSRSRLSTRYFPTGRRAMARCITPTVPTR